MAAAARTSIVCLRSITSTRSRRVPWTKPARRLPARHPRRCGSGSVVPTGDARSLMSLVPRRRHRSSQAEGALRSRWMAITPAEDRLRALFDATVALTSELSLDSLLQKLVETASMLTGARYAALGVIDEAGASLERFVTTGVGPETHAAIGDLPRGRGILGVLIREARPLRLRDLRDDPRSVGFPPNHPEMRSFLGVPILLRGVAYGNFYLTEKEGGEDFSEEDEELVTLLASQAAVAVENARLYESATQWSRQLEALHEVVQSLAGETDLERLLELVCRHVRDLTEARLALIALPAPDGDLRIAAAEGEGEAAYGLIGHRLRTRRSKSGRVLERRQSARVDSVFDDPEVDQEEARSEERRV